MSVSFIQQMAQDAIRVHDEECCTESSPCSTRAKLAGFHGVGVERGHELVKPSYGRGGQQYVGGNRSTPRDPNASEKQISFIKVLLDERDFFSLDDIDRTVARKVMAGEPIRGHQASRLITNLKVTAYSSKVSSNGFQKDRAKPEPKPELEAGIYLRDDVVYKVQRAVHGSGRMYAKALVVDEFGSARFEMAKGAIFKLAPEHRMTLEQAKEFGAVYGVCCRCGATLTDETSIEAGIGPVCAKSF